MDNFMIPAKTMEKLEERTIRFLKIKAVKEWKTPTRVKDIESFLGFANFY